MILNNKYIIGTQLMFYEIEMVEDYVQSVIDSVRCFDNPENVNVDFCFNISEFFEKIDTKIINKNELIDKFMHHISNLKKSGLNVTYEIYDKNEPKTMVEYRRNLNYFGCQGTDYVIWGESDCMIPNQTFQVLDNLKSYTDKNQIYNFIVTFAVRKMWDESWKILEHIDFEDKPYYRLGEDNERELALTAPHSIRSYMSLNEMNKINNKVEEPDVRIINYPKFDGSCLIASSNLLKTGVNIPPGFFGLAAEDTAFMYSCQKMMGNQYTQFVIKNILKVHNRNHPQKRNYIKGEKGDEINMGKRTSNNWFKSLMKINKDNLNRIFSNKQILSYEDWDFYNEKKGDL